LVRGGETWYVRQLDCGHHLGLVHVTVARSGLEHRCTLASGVDLELCHTQKILLSVGGLSCARQPPLQGGALRERERERETERERERRGERE